LIEKFNGNNILRILVEVKAKLIFVRG